MSVKIPEKLYYKIGEVSEITGVQPHVLRYWESEFRLIKPEKNSAGHRVYRKRDLMLVLRIKQLLYQERYTIAGAKTRLLQEAKHLEPIPESPKETLMQTVKKVKKGLRDLSEMLNH